MRAQIDQATGSRNGISFHWPSARFAFLGIRGGLIKALPLTPRYHIPVINGGFVSPEFGVHVVERQ